MMCPSHVSRYSALKWSAERCVPATPRKRSLALRLYHMALYDRPAKIFNKTQGNTTAAIGKGFAIGSAALVSLALFGAFCVRAHVEVVNILDPWCFSGLLYGAMMPYAFSAMTMKSVGEAANDMVNECMKQFPKILSGTYLYFMSVVQSSSSELRTEFFPMRTERGQPSNFWLSKVFT